MYVDGALLPVFPEEHSFMLFLLDIYLMRKGLVVVDDIY